MLSMAMARLAIGSPVPRLNPLNTYLHTSAAVERARQSTRIRKRKIHEANKKKKEERLRKNPPPIPKKVQLMLIAKGLGKDPRPWRTKDDKPFPCDDLWSERFFTWPRFSISEAISMLREHYHPTMHNVPDALIWAKLEFNLQTSKKERYFDSWMTMVPIYNPFERGVAEKHIMVFAKNPEAIKDAEAAGADKVGGLELVEEVVKGRVDVADMDTFLAHEDIEKELKPLLGILREKFPKKLNGTIGTDLGKMVQTFAHGMAVTVVKPKQTLGYADDPSYGFCEFQIGRLNMESTAIEANLTQALTTLSEKAPKRSGGFVTRCQLYCQGSLDIKFDVHHEMVEDAKLKEHNKKLAEDNVIAQEV